MNFVLKPSLEHRALVKTVVILWNQNDVKALIAKHDFSQYIIFRDEWGEIIEDRVIKKALQLPLPLVLKEKVLGFIKPIGLEISMWMRYHYKYLHVNLPAEFYWTPEGTIDRKRTAEVLIRNENLDTSVRCKIALIYCLEDDIYKFWNSFTEDIKTYFLETNFYFIKDWLHNMMTRRGLGNEEISEKGKFEHFALWGNKVAAEYFLQRLTLREREESLVKAAKTAEHAYIMCFLLAEMNEDQQIEAFKNNPCNILKCFLKWPLQNFFIAVANCMWGFLSKSDYYNVLIAIITKVKDGYKDYNYQEFFREFWQGSPSALKNWVINEMYKYGLLSLLFKIKDKEIIRLILKDASFAAKQRLIYSSNISDLCEYYFCSNEWDFLEFFFRECLASNDEMLKFKREFEKRMVHPYTKQHLERNKLQWDQLFQLSDESVSKYSSKNVEEGECSSST